MLSSTLFYMAMLLGSDSAIQQTPCQQAMQQPEPSSLSYQCLRLAYQQDIQNWPSPHVDADIAWEEMAPIPQIQPSTAEQAKIELGRRLFFDPQLSRSQQIACASCHEPDLTFADGRKISFGHDRRAGRRNSPSIIMSAFHGKQFWDGRADSLEVQALHPIVDPVEMAFTLEEMLERINHSDSYQTEFNAVFGSSTIQAEDIGQALAAYQRSLATLASRTKYDRFLRGQHQRLTDQQIHGLHLFRTKARCMNCHFGVSLSDNQFHNLGLTYYQRKYHDAGRYEVTGDPADMGSFKTPSLRLVSRTGPWFHNGLFPSLRGVLNMYNAGMPRPKPKAEQLHDPLYPVTSPRLHQLQLSEAELQALQIFLETL